MLYISRCKNFDTYGVVDTDDGVEEFLTLEQIIDVINVQGIMIDGVVPRWSSDYMMRTVDRIYPYQPDETRKPIQIKANMLYNVDITVFRNVISWIRVKGEKISTPGVLRLSDFGTEVADCVLRGNKWPRGHKVTLVLDDKLKIAPKAFRVLPYADKNASIGTYGVGVVFDIREVTNMSIVESVYRAMLNGDQREIKTSIIDDECRKRRMIQTARRWRKGD